LQAFAGWISQPVTAAKGANMSTKDSSPGLALLGEFIRGQRKMMALSQRELAKLTQVSDPYVSQLERGLHAPSIRVLRAFSEALNVRAETMMQIAGLLDVSAAESTVEDAIHADSHLSAQQKSALVGVYRGFREQAAESR